MWGSECGSMRNCFVGYTFSVIKNHMWVTLHTVNFFFLIEEKCLKNKTFQN